MTTGDTVELATPMPRCSTRARVRPGHGQAGRQAGPGGRPGRIFGYTQFLDVSARGLPGGFFLGKSWHTFGPMGPVLVTADEIRTPTRSACACG